MVLKAATLEAGTPPGRWLGSRLHTLGDGEINPEQEVAAQQLALLLGTSRDPVSGEPLRQRRKQSLLLLSVSFHNFGKRRRHAAGGRVTPNPATVIRSRT